MSELSPEEEDIYRSLKLRLIIDLRRDDEVTERPTPSFGSEDNIHISVSDPDNAFAEAAAKAHEEGAEKLILADAVRYYREVVTDNLHRYIPVFEQIFDAENHPVLFHCTAGKDRTGFVAAALLKFLGVDWQICILLYCMHCIVSSWDQLSATRLIWLGISFLQFLGVSGTWRPRRCNGVVAAALRRCGCRGGRLSRSRGGRGVICIVSYCIVLYCISLYCIVFQIGRAHV